MHWADGCIFNMQLACYLAFVQVYFWIYIRLIKLKHTIPVNIEPVFGVI